MLATQPQLLPPKSSRLDPAAHAENRAARFRRRLAERTPLPLNHRMAIADQLDRLGHLLIDLANDVVHPEDQPNHTRRAAALGLHFAAINELEAYLRNAGVKTGEPGADFNDFQCDLAGWVTVYDIKYRAAPLVTPKEG